MFESLSAWSERTLDLLLPILQLWTFIAMALLLVFGFVLAMATLALSV